MNEKKVSSMRSVQFDAIVIGGGIAGLQSALDLADQGFKVAILEKDATIGGKMIRLSKVFPTLDCSSCITTPKMAAAAHHENITLFTFCELDSLERDGENGFLAHIRQKPRYVDPGKCIGCRKCEYACPIYLPDPEQGGFSARKAIYVPFSNAIPQIALIDAQNCLLCGKCEKACPTRAVDFFQQPNENGKLIVCIPCIRERKIDESDLIEGAKPGAAAALTHEILSANSTLVY